MTTTTQAQPRRTNDVARDSGYASATRRWLQRFVRALGFKLAVRQAGRMKYRHLSTEERYEIGAMRRQKLGMGEIAEHLGRHRSTIYREVKRNQSVHDGCYRPSHAV